jgi:hypothetical protein
MRCCSRNACCWCACTSATWNGAACAAHCCCQTRSTRCTQQFTCMEPCNMMLLLMHALTTHGAGSLSQQRPMSHHASHATHLLRTAFHTTHLLSLDRPSAEHRKHEAPIVVQHNCCHKLPVWQLKHCGPLADIGKERKQVPAVMPTQPQLQARGDCTCAFMCKPG